MDKPGIASLPRLSDRLTFLYLEKCQINRKDNAITVTDETGVVHVPAATVTALLLGPGTTVTHRAMELVSDTGICAVWVGEHGVRYYAAGRSLSRNSSLLLKQAQLVTNVQKHAAVVRKMYIMRFPNEDVSELTIQQLRGREGSRIRKVYAQMSEKYNVPWNGRNYDPNDYEAGDPVNQALSAGNSCLYGLALAVISALGCSAGLGFVHVGHEFSFAYDIADLYKAEITIPLAFQLAGTEATDDIGMVMRRRTRDAMVKSNILERMVKDIQILLNTADDAAEDTEEADIVEALYLWNGKKPALDSGKQYAEEE